MPAIGPARAATALALAALLLAGCGGSTRNVVSGGAVPGSSRTVYSLLPHPDRAGARDFVLGEKLAIHEAGGRAGGYALSFVSFDESAAGPRALRARAGVQAQQAVHDAQVVAIVGGTSSEAAKVTVPLIDAAGILHVLVGAGYPGFTRRWADDGEPARWQPSGAGDDVVRLTGDDTVQARALLAAAVRAARARPGARSRPRGARPRTRVAIAREPGPDAAGLRDALVAVAGDDRATSSVRIVAATDRADAVVYAGEDPAAAAAVARAPARRGTPVVLGDAVVMAGVRDRLRGAARRRAVLVSSAPAPGSAAVRALAPAFRAAYGRAPGPYAVLGHDAMRAVIAAVDAAAPHDDRRQAVTAAFATPPWPGYSTYRADGRGL